MNARMVFIKNILTVICSINFEEDWCVDELTSTAEIKLSGCKLTPNQPTQQHGVASPTYRFWWHDWPSFNESL